MTNPAIQNDFSYYRRTISRMRINNLSVRNTEMCRQFDSPEKSVRMLLTVFFFLQADTGNEVNNELANRMSLFYASATPMLKTLSDATSKFVSDVSPCFYADMQTEHEDTHRHTQLFKVHSWNNTGVMNISACRRHCFCRGLFLLCCHKPPAGGALAPHEMFSVQRRLIKFNQSFKGGTC